MKRVLTVLLCAVLLLTAAGCGSMLEGEIVSVETHAPQYGVTQEDFPTLRASSYEEITDALLTIVQNGDEYGVIRISAYDGDPETDVNNACMEVSCDTPLGAYAVYYMSCAVSHIVSYYDAEITVTYKKTPLEISCVTSADTLTGLDTELRLLLSTYGSQAAIRLHSRLADVTPEYVAARVAELYYGDPSLSVARPTVTAAFYPEGSPERILEVTLKFPYTVARLNNMYGILQAAADELVQGVVGMDRGHMLLSLCQTLSDTVEYDLESEEVGAYDPQARENTAYGALIDGRATGEGFAMAMKLLCQRLGIGCTVVSGRRDSIDHGWNIVRLSGSSYHIDASVIAREGLSGAFLLNDEAMSLHCWWDTTLYDPCLGDLTAADFLAPLSPSDPGASAPPVVTEPLPPSDDPSPSDSPSPSDDPAEG